MAGVTRSGTALYESKNKYHELSGVYLRTRTPCKRRKGTWRLLGTKVTGGAKPGRAEPLASCRYLVRTARGVIKAEQKLRHNEWWKVTRKRNLYQARGVILSQTIGPNQSPAKLLPVAVAGIPIAGNYRINVLLACEVMTSWLSPRQLPRERGLGVSYFFFSAPHFFLHRYETNCVSPRTFSNLARASPRGHWITSRRARPGDPVDP